MSRKHLLVTTTALIFVGVALFLSLREQGDSHLQAFVIAAPEYPIVFTSRSNTASLRAASVLGEGYITDTGAKYAVPTFDVNSLDRIAFYSTARDRFNDPVQPRIRGSIRKLHEEPIKDGDVRTLLPVDEPTILMGIGKDGKLASVLGAADSTGNRGKFYALAADHYSGARPNGYHFCTSCHAGHSHTGGPTAAREVLK